LGPEPQEETAGAGSPREVGQTFLSVPFDWDADDESEREEQIFHFSFLIFHLLVVDGQPGLKTR
jgi:hypothetical protein